MFKPSASYALDSSRDLLNNLLGCLLALLIGSLLPRRDRALSKK